MSVGEGAVLPVRVAPRPLRPATQPGAPHPPESTRLLLSLRTVQAKVISSNSFTAEAQHFPLQGGENTAF